MQPLFYCPSMSDVKESYQQQDWAKVIQQGKKLIQRDELAENTIKETYLMVGSALKKSDQLDEAIAWYEKGIQRFPDLAGLHHNLGNCHRAKGDDRSRWVAIEHYLKAQNLGLNAGSLILSLAKTYQDLSFSALAYDTLKAWMSTKNVNEIPGPEHLVNLLDLSNILLSDELSEPICKWCLDHFGELAKNSLQGQASLATYKAKAGDIDEALEWFEKAKKSLVTMQEEEAYSLIEEQKLKDSEQALINAGWNLGCTLLKKGEMKTGWDLYNYGLLTPAGGLQKWQRALVKPYHNLQIPIWTGIPLKNQSILVMGEQGIGDSMMFLQMLPSLLKETESITLVLPSRLTAIYQRTYPTLKIYSDQDLNSLPEAKQFNYQIPCGSIPALKLQQWLKSGWEQTTLKADNNLVKELRSKYLDNAKNKTLLIGISWSGGGKAERIRNKSLTTDQFKEIFHLFPEARFVSLQYGKVKKIADKWNSEGFNVIYDETVDAIKDMDRWLAQVDACDLVISVANTTVHGAGGLKKPTLCLQSRTSDWRWIEGCPYSYWYESVWTQCQARDGNWQPAIKAAKEWWENNSDKHTTKETKIKTITNMIK